MFVCGKMHLLKPQQALFKYTRGVCEAYLGKAAGMTSESRRASKRRHGDLRALSVLREPGVTAFHSLYEHFLLDHYCFFLLLNSSSPLAGQTGSRCSAFLLFQDI